MQATTADPSAASVPPSPPARPSPPPGLWAPVPPGVPTMGLTTLALGPDRASSFAPRGVDVTVHEDFLPALRVARVPFAVVQALLGVAIAALMGRLGGAGPGLGAGLLLPAEPFWAGVGPIVGMDGLLSGL